jgi:hypothetical protein
VGEDGIEHPCTEAELTFALSSEQLPVYTLVWKQGWPEWLPAMQVAELSWALPAGTADLPQKPSGIETSSRRPPPLVLYPEYRRRAEDIASGRINPQAQIASSPSATSSPSFGSPSPGSPSLGGLRRELTPGTSRVQPRPGETPSAFTGFSTVANLRDLRPFSREDEDEPTVQIDADSLERERLLSLLDIEVDSVPVRGDQVPAYYPLETPRPVEGPRHAEASPRPDNWRPSEALRSPGFNERLPQATLASAPLAAHPLTDRPQARRLSLTPSAPEATGHQNAGALGGIHLPGSANLPGSGLPGGVNLQSSGLNNQAPRSDGGTAATRSQSGRFPFFPIAAALALGAVGALWLRSETPSERQALPLPEKPQPPPPSVHIPNCRVGQPGTLLAEWLYPKIEPTVTNVPGSNKLAVGYAQTSRFAVGVTLDPESLRIEKLFSEFQNSPLLSVTPMTQVGNLNFRTTRAAATLQSSTALNVGKPFAFGWTRDGFAIRRDSAAQDEILWKSAFTTANVPAVARFDATSFLFALRAGGDRGSLLLGKLLENGSAGSELLPVKFPEGRLGVPTLRIGPTFTLATFTLGNSELRGDVYLAHAPVPKIPEAAELVLQTRDGVFSPEAIELSPDSFVLQYTRGEPGNQQVVAQTYTFNGMQKQGTELLVSPSNVDAHAGSIWRHQKGFLSLYAVHTDQAYALWATRIDCE